MQDSSLAHQISCAHYYYAILSALGGGSGAWYETALTSATTGSGFGAAVFGATYYGGALAGAGRSLSADALYWTEMELSGGGTASRARAYLSSTAADTTIRMALYDSLGALVTYGESETLTSRGQQIAEVELEPTGIFAGTYYLAISRGAASVVVKTQPSVKTTSVRIIPANVGFGGAVFGDTYYSGVSSTGLGSTPLATLPTATSTGLSALSLGLLVQ